MSKWVGKPLKRKEDFRLLTGRGKYIDDIVLPNMLHAAILRSPYPHAIIKNIDVSEARKLSGVVYILTGEELAQMTGPMLSYYLLQAPPTTQQYFMAFRKVRFVGEPVAAVAAETKEAAKDALELINVEYEPLKTVIDPEEAMKENAPILYEDAGTNILYHNIYVYGDVEKEFKEADVILSEKLSIHPYTSAPLETFGCIASYDGFSLTVWSPDQIPGMVVRALSAAIKIPEDKIRIISAQDIGGGYGIKTTLLPYMVIVSALSLKTLRPVKWIEERHEHFMAAGHSAGGRFYVQLALTRDGLVRAIRLKTIEDEGIFSLWTCLYWLLKLTNIVNCYKIRAVYFEPFSVATNKCAAVPNRGVGKPGMCYIIERMMNLAAQRLGLTPEEIRFRNFIPPEEFPYRTPTGNLYDSGRYAEALKLLLEKIEIEKLREEQRKLREQGRYIGIGISTGLEPSVSNFSYFEFMEVGRPNTTGASSAARVTITPGGKVVVAIGSPCSGQGHETTLAQVVAEELGITPEDVTVLPFDTQSCPTTSSQGLYANRFVSMDLGAVTKALSRLKEKILRIAASQLDAPLESLTFGDGKIYVKDSPDRAITLESIATIAYSDVLKLKDIEPGLTETAYYVHPSADRPDDKKRMSIQLVFGYNFHAAVVEVDIETGQVKILRYVVVADCGRIINPMIVEGQVHGATAHGIASALYEGILYNEEGQCLTTTYTDFGAASAVDLPNIEVYHIETPSPFTVMGAKGVGEGGAIPSPAAIANAVEDALSPFGVKITELPITPEKILRLIKQSQKK